MQFTSFFTQGIKYVVSTARSQAAPTLIYRGVSYPLPHQRLYSAALAPLMGRQLTYRGTVYEMGATLPMTKKTAKKMHSLIYRGASYMQAM